MEEYSKSRSELIKRYGSIKIGDVEYPKTKSGNINSLFLTKDQRTIKNKIDLKKKEEYNNWLYEELIKALG
jgi:hypothetical protein